MIQRTLLIMKPDSLKRGLVGEIISRIERVGMKIIAAKMINAPIEKTKAHYKKDRDWHIKIGKINIKDCKEFGLDIEEIYGSTDPEEIGKKVNEQLYEILESAPALMFIFQGPHAVEKVRKIVGSTYPNTAEMGTIRGDLGVDSPAASLIGKRNVLNLVHASGTVEEAEKEIQIWFEKDEICDNYDRCDTAVYGY